MTTTKRTTFATVWDAIEDSREIAASLRLRAEVANAIIEETRRRASSCGRPSPSAGNRRRCSDSMQPATIMSHADGFPQPVRRMEVFSLWDATNRRPTVDVLLACPIPFTELLKDSVIVTLGAVQIRVASVTHLMNMKQRTARPRDLEDVERLRVLQQRGRPS
jgi:hypothetical protein